MNSGTRSTNRKRGICLVLLSVVTLGCHQPMMADPPAPVPNRPAVKRSTTRPPETTAKQSAQPVSTLSKINPEISREHATLQKNLDESRIRAIDQKMKILKEAEDRCEALDRNAAIHIQKLRDDQAYDAAQNRLTRSGFPGMNGSSLYDGDARDTNRLAEYRIQMAIEDAEKQKRSIMSQAHARVDGWDSTVDTIKSELEHPGDTVQMMPHRGNPYVKDYMNMGDPDEVVPLRAKTLTTPQKPKSKAPQVKITGSRATTTGSRATTTGSRATTTGSQATTTGSRATSTGPQANPGGPHPSSQQANSK